jgi:hypothetical protein
MASMLVCFNLSTSAGEQIRQISFWLDFLNSSLSPPPLCSTSVPKWNIILVGVRADEQQDFSLTQNPHIITSWKKKWSRLPIAPILFTVSSLKSIQSIQSLLAFVTEACGQILDKHTTQIPTSYHSFMLHLQHLSKESPLLHWSDLHTKLQKNFGAEFKMDEAAFKCMLQYIQSIGRIVWLPTGWVFTDATLAPRIAAKFVSPRDVRLALLKQDTEKVQILDGTEVGCLLDIDTSDNKKYSTSNFTIFFAHKSKIGWLMNLSSFST